MERISSLPKKNIAKWLASGSIATGSLVFGGHYLVENSEAEDGQVSAQGYSQIYSDVAHFVVLPNVINEGLPPTPTPTSIPESTPTPEILYIHPDPHGRILNSVESDSAPSYDKEIWRKLFSQYDWDVDDALKVMYCESRANPWVTGNNGEWGLMQMHPYYQTDRFIKLFGEDFNPYDPEQNVAAAYLLYSDRGFSPWSCAKKLGLSE